MKDSSMCLSLTTHPGKLTKEDIKKNLRKAIDLSNEYGEDWLQVMGLYWYNKTGMVNPTEDEEELEDEEIIDREIDEMTDEWGAEKSSQALYLLQEAGRNEELIPVEGEMLEYLENNQDIWTLQYILAEELGLETGPY